MNNIYGLKDDEIKKLIKEGRLKVSIVGFGYIGTCMGALIADGGNHVTGFDANPSVVDKINCGECSIPEPGLKELIKKSRASKKMEATLDKNKLNGSDLIIVTVGTPIDENYVPNLKYIREASETISEILEPGNIVLIKSTVPPHTTENIIKPILEKSGLKAGIDFALAFCPERLAEGSALKELKTIPVVIGGINKKSSDAISTIWQSLFGVETLIVSSPAAAELTKLADNLWIDLNIALANELAMLCDKLGVSAIEVINAANTLPKGSGKVNILLPSMGVGGYCLPKDPWFVYHLGKKHGLELKTPKTSREINTFMPIYTFDLIRQMLQDAKKDMQKSKVAVLGLSFKNNTGDIRNTPAKITIDLLLKNGCNVSVYDPLVNEEEAKSVTAANVSGSLDDAVKNADCVAFFAAHDEFKKISFTHLKTLVAQDCFMLDGRNSLDRQSVKSAGFTYKGIGV